MDSGREPPLRDPVPICSARVFQLLVAGANARVVLVVCRFELTKHLLGTDVEASIEDVKRAFIGTLEITDPTQVQPARRESLVRKTQKFTFL